MQLKSFGPFDRALLALAVVVLLLSSWAIVNDQWMYALNSDEVKSLQKIGEIHRTRNDVRRRFKSRFSWMPAEESEAVYIGDSIFTGPDSDAVIVTDTGSELSISSNSLVVINTREDALFLDVDFGSIQGKFERGKKVLVGSQDGVAVFDGEEQESVVKFDVGKDQNLVVNVLEGQVRLSSKGRSQKLGTNQGAEIDSKGHGLDPSKIQITPEGPLVNQRLQAHLEKPDWAFRWRSNHNFILYQVETSTDPDFKETLFEDRTSRTELALPAIPKDVKIYWRISAQFSADGAPIRSPVSHFVLSSNTPPTALYPINHAIYNLASGRGPQDQGLHVSMHWSPGTPSEKWEVQLSQSNDFSSKIKSYISPSDHVVSESLDPGQYFWRVRANDAADGEWSAVQSFSILVKSQSEKVAPLLAKAESRSFLIVTNPKDATAETLKSLSTQEASKYMESVPRLTWNSLPGAVKYELEVAAEPQFNKIVHRGQQTTPHYDLKQVGLGNYYWRVQAHTVEGALPPSPTQVVQIGLSPPKSLTDGKKIEELDDLTQVDKLPAPFDLRWSPTLFTQGYEVEFDNSGKFTKPLVIQTSSASKQVQVKTPGRYYWRVRSLDKEGRPISLFSPVYEYDYQRVFKNQQQADRLRPIYPNNRESLVYVGNQNSPIYFRWTTPFKKGTVYDIELASDEKFEQVLLTYSDPSGLHKFTKKLPDGWYFWRLRARTDHFEGPWSSTYSFQVKYEKSPFEAQGVDRLKALKSLQEENLQKLNPESIARKTSSVTPDKPAVPNAPNSPAPTTPETKGAPIAAPTAEASNNEDFTYRIAEPEDLSLESLNPSLVAKRYRNILSEPTLSWNAVPGAVSYRVEIYRGDNNSTPLHTKEVKDTRLIWKGAKPGQYEWRVQTLDAARKQGAFSQLRKFEIRVQAPVSLSASAVVQVVKTPARTPKPFLLMWTPTPHTQTYEFDFSTDPLFQNVKSFKERHFTKKLKVSNPGTYFWRVRALTTDGKPASVHSPVYSVKVAVVQSMESPESSISQLFPVDNEAIQLVGEDPGHVPLVWRGRRNGPTYEVEISQSPDLKNPLAKLYPSGEFVILRNKLKGGTYYWRVNAGGNSLGKGTIQSFVVEKHNLNDPVLRLPSSRGQ